MRTGLLGWIVLAGCGGSGTDSAGPVDVDGDGFAGAVDCDDSRPGVNPDAPEVTADGIDQNCDGMDRCYADGDGDTYGTTATVIAASCDDAGASTTSDDCNDADAASHPGAEEPCDEDVDYDCDGKIAFVDGDIDGSAACVDCDDVNPDVHPGAPEIVADGADQDCDSGDQCFVDADGDHFGTTAVVASSDLDCADAGESASSDDCLDAGDDAAATWPGAAASESATECMTDADGDGWGAESPASGVTPGSDCDDTDSAVSCLSLHIGNDVEFAESSGHSPDYLLGSALVVPADMTVSALALIGKSSIANVKMALYTDAGGAPDALVVSTDSTPVPVGVLEIPVKDTPISAGTYWIMGVYDTNASIGIDYSVKSEVVMYQSFAFSSAIPTTFGTATSYTGQRFNYYIVVH